MQTNLSKKKKKRIFFEQVKKRSIDDKMLPSVGIHTVEGIGGQISFLVADPFFCALFS